MTFAELNGEGTLHVSNLSSAPATPSSGEGKVYCGTDKSVRAVFSDGQVRTLTEAIGVVYKVQGNTSYTPSTGARFVRLIGKGGGAGGGGANSTTGGQLSMGSAGGAGEHAELWLVLPSTGPFTIQVGAGGAGGSGAADGVDGTDTTFHDGTSVVLRAKGGTKGTFISSGNTAGTVAAGGAGGTGGTGDVLLPGCVGGSAFRISGTLGFSGAGSVGLWGNGGGKMLFGSGAGNDAPHKTGAGGGGGFSAAGDGAVAGGQGGNGLLVIEEYR